MPALSSIKSMQYGTVSGFGTSETATINAVNVNKAAVHFLGWNASGTTYNPGKVTLTNSTTVTGTFGAAAGGATLTINFVVVEFY